ncbi:hypothetical protein [Sphingomonas sp.]|uniref:hypothetical protein n=1 Tax=Sphingomonas sp. TaxID=28214 RepID=UPI003AFF75DE
MLRQGDNVGAELEATLKLLASLEPGYVARADGEFASAAGLYRQPLQSLFGRLLSPRFSDAEQLLRVLGLEYLFLFQRDGQPCEAALLKTTAGMPTPFLFVQSFGD